MAVELIIKGAIYVKGEELLRPHYTGYFIMVDCTEFKRKKAIRQEYDKAIAKDFIKDGTFITYNRKKYYECEYGPHTTEDMEPLSDFSKLEFYDDETEFND